MKNRIKLFFEYDCDCYGSYGDGPEDYKNFFLSLVIRPDLRIFKPVANTQSEFLGRLNLKISDF